MDWFKCRNRLMVEGLPWRKSVLRMTAKKQSTKREGPGADTPFQVTSRDLCLLRPHSLMHTGLLNSFVDESPDEYSTP